MKKSKIFRLLSLMVCLTMLCILTSCSRANNSNTEYTSDNSNFDAASEKPLEYDITSDNSNFDAASEKPLEYDIIIMSGSEGGSFEDAFLYHGYEEKTEKYQDQPKTVITVGNAEFEAYKTETTKNSEGFTYDKYLSEDGKTEYEICRNNDLFIISAKDGSFLQKYDSSELTEEKLTSAVIDYLRSLIPDEDLTKYDRKCVTRVGVKKPKAAWAENKDCFYIPDSDSVNESVYLYTFNFVLYCNGIKTADRINVDCDGSGNVQRIIYSNYNVDWNSIRIDEDDLQTRAESFIWRALSHKYTLKKITLQSQTLKFADSKIRLDMEYSLTVEENGMEYVILCILRITP